MHIGPDSSFLRLASDAFESVAPGANEYVVLTETVEAPLHFPIPFGRISKISLKNHRFPRVLFHAQDCDMIIAHSMTRQAAMAFMFAPNRTVKVWSGWGYDYYGDDKSPESELLGESTRELALTLEDTNNRRNPIWNAIRSVSRLVDRRLVRGAAANTDYFSAPIPDDLRVFRARFPQFTGEYSQLSYGSVKATFAHGVRDASKTDILVGNSATPTNNHLEMFDRLARLDLSGRRIIVPLSYGNPIYRDAIISRGSELFGTAFTPIVDLLPLHEYFSIVASCDVVIMNHKRQQALGNIGAAMYHGTHIYLDQENPIVDFFRSRGAFLATTDELEVDGLPLTALSDAVVATNRRVLETFWGSSSVSRNVETIVATLPGRRPK